MDRPLISLFQMGYNQADSIEQSLWAILAQTYSPLEIVFSDDCSSDDTFEIMTRVAREYDGPHQVILNRNPKNRGIVGNVNVAVSLLSGELIVQANGDDISAPDRVEKLYQVWATDPENIKMVHSDMANINLDGLIIGQARTNNLVSSDVAATEVIYRNGYIAGSCVAFTPDLFSDFGPIPECATVEDHVLPFRALYRGRIVHLPETLVQWRIGGISWVDKDAVNHPKNTYFGEKLKVEARLAKNHQAHLIDLSQLTFPKKADVVKHSRKYIAMANFLVKTANLPIWRLILRAPLAYFYTVSRNDKHYLRVHFRYLFRPFTYPIAVRKFERIERQ